MSCITCHVSHVTCHVSPVTCHLSRVTSHLSHDKIFFFITFFFIKITYQNKKNADFSASLTKNWTKWWSWSLEGMLSTGPTLSSLKSNEPPNQNPNPLTYCYFSTKLAGHSSHHNCSPTGNILYKIGEAKEHRKHSWS